MRNKLAQFRVNSVTALTFAFGMLLGIIIMVSCAATKQYYRIREYKDIRELDRKLQERDEGILHKPKEFWV